MSNARAYHLVVQTGTLVKLPAFFYSGSGRALWFVLALLFATVSVRAQTKIRSLTNVIEGHAVGGVTVDLVGNIYVADFGEYVWKITPEGKRDVFASGFYGASGNAIDNGGNLLQSNFYGNSITKIDRKGEAKPFVTSGLSGPVGIAINKQTGDVYVANCRGNSIAKIATDGTVSSFAKSDLFSCPNGISFDREGNLYVVNFRDNKMLKVDPKGFVAPFATISKKGLGHLCFKEDRFYVTAFESHEIYEVTLDGTVKRILGDGNRGVVDGAAAKARLSFPNGIAYSPWGRRLYINEYVNDSESSLPRRTIVREITLEAAK
jgi:DNA-binding beta-propeller fold protein YncE